MLFHRNLPALLTAIILLKVAIVTGEIYFKKGSPQVKLSSDAIASGAVKFSRNGRPFSAFIGLPFATIPERFEEPQLIKTPEWKGVKEFTTAGPMCPQMSLIPGQKLFEEEDCLNLNVYVPMNNTGCSKGYPVMVWIHGGSFTIGNGYGYGPSFFTDEDVILITINYRLGIFGFLSTGDEVAPGNNGMKDQVAALKWVKENVAKFGGNPDKVTIFGESAGSAAVQYLMLSDQAKGLFHRAIGQSGGVLCPWAYQPNPKQNALDVATHLKCSEVSSSAEIVKCLKGASKDELNLAQFTYSAMWPSGFPPFAFVPTFEPEAGPTSKHTPFLTKSTIELLLTTPMDIPWLVGLNEDEAATFMVGALLTDEKLIQEINSKWSDNIMELIMSDKYYPVQEHKDLVAEKLRKFYLGDKPVSTETADEYINLASDAMFVFGINKGVQDVVSSGNNKAPIYLYQYAYHGPVTVGKLFFPHLREQEAGKVGHADELQHQFDMDDHVFPGISGAVKEDTPDAEFSRNMVRLWTSFAKHGEPKHSWGKFSSEKWSPVSKDNLNNLPWHRIDSNPKMLKEDPYKERMEFWNDLWENHIIPKDGDCQNKRKNEL